MSQSHRHREIGSDDYRLHWREGPSGLIVPDVIEHAGTVWPSSTSAFDTTLRENLLDHRIRVVPGVSDLWPNQRITLDELLASLPLGMLLRALAALVAGLASRSIPRSDIQRLACSWLDAPAQQRLKAIAAKHPADLVYEFQLLLAIEVALARAPRRSSPATVTDPIVPQRVLQFVLLVHELVMKQSITEPFAATYAGLAAALAERSILGSVPLLLCRSFGIWLWDHPFVTEQCHVMRTTCAKAIVQETGCDLMEWVASLHGVCYQLTTRERADIANGALLLEPGDWRVSNRAQGSMQRLLGSLSQPEGALRRECARVDHERSLIDRPSLYPLRGYPTLRKNDNGPFLVLSPTLFAIAGCYFPIHCAIRSGALTSNKGIGTLVEDYVLGLLWLRYGNRVERLTQQKSRKRADAAVVFEKGAVVVEVKGRRLSESRRFQSRSNDEFRRDLDDLDVSKGVNQVWTTGEDILSGRLDIGCPCREIIGSLVVVPDDLPLNVMAESVLCDMLPPSRTQGAALQLRPQLVGLGELEQLDSWRVSLLTVLDRKMRHSALSVEGLVSYLEATQAPRGASETIKVLSEGLAESWSSLESAT